MGFDRLHGPFIQTFTGKRFFYDAPTVDMVCIEDIAHALARLCRWTGHSEFYTVAEHCVRVSYDVPPGFEMDGLGHDAREAYVGDMNSPLKKLCPDYVRVEKRAAKVVAEYLAIAVETPPEVVASDLRLLSTERRDLFDYMRDWGWEPPTPLNERIRPLTIEQAESAFLTRFKHLDDIRKGAAAQ